MIKVVYEKILRPENETRVQYYGDWYNQSTIYEDSSDVHIAWLNEQGSQGWHLYSLHPRFGIFWREEVSGG